MSTEQSYSEWLASLDKGSQVALPSIGSYGTLRYVPPQLGRVVRTTATQIVTCFGWRELRYSKSSGKEVGGNYDAPKLVCPTPAFLAECQALKNRERFATLSAKTLGDDEIAAILATYDSLQAGKAVAEGAA